MPRQNNRLVTVIVVAVLAVLTVTAGVVAEHVGPAFLSKGSEPVNCTLHGGHWDLWNGWQCGPGGEPG